jgi:hypothetical protein
MNEIDKVETVIGDATIVRDKDYTHGFVDSKIGVYTFDYCSTYGLPSTNILQLYNGNRSLQPMIIGDYKIIPNGNENNYPEELRLMIEENNLLPAVLDKKTTLLMGQSQEFYEVRFENGRRIKYFDADTELEKWADDWNSKRYVEEVATEFMAARGYYSKFYRNKGARIGSKAYITELKSVSNRKARLEWYDENDNVNAIITGNYLQPWEKGLKRFPIWDRKNPFNYPVAMRYNNLYGFALDNEYSRAAFHGSRSSIRLASSIAVLLMTFNDNSAAIKYHVKVPAIFWQQKIEQLEKECIKNGTEITQKLIDKMKDSYLLKFVDVLSSYKNVGKFISTDVVWHDEAKEFIGWEIVQMDQKIKDFVDAQLNILSKMDLEITSGLDLDPALSNITREGNLPSGSEKLYAFKLYLLTSTDLHEDIIMRDFNDALKANFPGTKKRRGFYHDAVITEAQTNPNDRIKNSSSAPNP